MSATAGQLRRLASLILAASIAGGCANIGGSIPRRDATESLVRHPQFPAAAKAAPAFVTEALEIITTYEAELAARK